MATRSSEASTLNTTLGTLVTDVSAYLTAGVGDHYEARQAVWNALVSRLSPIIGPPQFKTPATVTDNVPDQVHADV